jgi:hypothetical protein
VPQPDDIDNQALRGVEPERTSCSDFDQVAAKIEGAPVELVQPDRCPQRRPDAALLQPEMKPEPRG